MENCVRVTLLLELIADVLQTALGKKEMCNAANQGEHLKWFVFSFNTNCLRFLHCFKVFMISPHREGIHGIVSLCEINKYKDCTLIQCLNRNMNSGRYAIKMKSP